MLVIALVIVNVLMSITVNCHARPVFSTNSPTPFNEELPHTPEFSEQQPDPPYEGLPPPHTPDLPHQHLDPYYTEEWPHLPDRWSPIPPDEEPNVGLLPLPDLWSSAPGDHAHEELPGMPDHWSPTPPEEHPAEEPP
ncbi:hypothetical protein SCLCIDRAFT_31280 [Scleroderma citrinum Foug A]|uniref:Uncharacterized protein n=1 Tax=Scleroderma citrinum Foug A TaxID=1036808 RepID=A0A0C2ZNI5_9AGAM|nr:hypothetical protein SCLCIDRAFT_31280 [Scleroderma citrinum Foug A]